MSGIEAIGSGGRVLWRQFYRASNLAAAKNAALNPSQPQRPVEPVAPVRPVSSHTGAVFPILTPQLPSAERLNDAGEVLAGMRAGPFDPAADGAFARYRAERDAHAAPGKRPDPDIARQGTSESLCPP